MAASVPSKAAYQAATQLWHARAHTYRASGAVGWLADTTGHQYDAEAGLYYVMDTTGDTATWTSRVTRAWQEYNYYVNTFAVPAGQIATYLMHLDGFFEDYTRSVTRSPTSVANVNSILTQAPYMVGDGGDDMTPVNYSREVAYVLRAHIFARRMGISLSAAQISRESTMLTRSLGHITKWLAGDYCRTFMAALTARSLIDYYIYVSALPDIKTKLEALGNYIRTNCWKATDGSWGVGQAFRYQDKIGGGETDTNTAPDLSAIICPLFAWLWYQTGTTAYRNWHDEAFVAGIPVYSGDTQISGSYQGTSTTPALKQINQQTYWAPQGIIWAELDPLIQTPGVTLPVLPITIPNIEGASKSGICSDAVVTITASGTTTVVTPAAGKYILVLGIQYKCGVAHTLTAISGSTNLDKYEFTETTGGGLSLPTSRRPIWVCRVGEAFKLSSTAIVNEIYVTYAEVDYWEI